VSELPSSEDLDPSTGTDAPTPPTTTGPLEVTVAHQLAVTPGRAPFLAPPKTKTSLRVNELPAEIGAVLRDHLDAFAPARIELDAETDPRRPRTRVANLLFTRGDGRPIHRGAWTHIWRPAVKKAGLPEGSGSATCGTTSRRC